MHGSKKKWVNGSKQRRFDSSPDEKKTGAAHRLEPLAEPRAAYRLFEHAPWLTRLPAQSFDSQATPVDVLRWHRYSDHCHSFNYLSHFFQFGNTLCFHSPLQFLLIISVTVMPVVHVTNGGQGIAFLFPFFPQRRN